MRMAFGLVSLLVTLFIILMLFKTYEAPMLKKGKSATDDARQLAGRDEDNAPVTDAVKLEAQDRNGKMEGALVASITPGSTLQKKYGLQSGDVILELGQLSVRGNISSADEARDFLLSAYQRNEPVVVMRGSQKLTLPLPPGVVVPPAPVAAPVASGAPADGATADGSPPEASPAAADASQAPAESQPPAPAATAKAKEPKPKGGLEGQLDVIRNLPGNQ
jgi:hypothetical protein